MDQSLPHIVGQNEQFNLSNQHNAQAHPVGMIQSAGGLIMLDARSQQIIGASENLARLMGIDAVSALGMPISAIDPGLAAELHALAQDATGTPEVFANRHEAAAGRYDLMTHVHNGEQILEFIPNSDGSADAARKRLQLSTKACADIAKAPDVAAAQDCAAQFVRQITRCDLVNICHFLPDWSAIVDASDAVTMAPSPRGLRIPKEHFSADLHAMQTGLTHRAVGQLTDENTPVLATRLRGQQQGPMRAMLNAVSRQHAALLRSMGFGASFTTALHSEGQLWGVIVCHSAAESVMTADSWPLVRHIGSALMLRLQQHKATSETKAMADVRQLEKSFITALHTEGKVEQAIRSHLPALQRLLHADGFAFQWDHCVYTSGATPPADFIRGISTWAHDRLSGDGQFETSCLLADFPLASQHLETACGVLVQSLAMPRLCRLIWFRQPALHVVTKAGCCATRTGGERHSPASAQRTVSPDNRPLAPHAQSLPWGLCEQDNARQLFTPSLEVIVALFRLKAENESLKHFAYAAAHDIKAPLRGVKMALDWMAEDDFDEVRVKEHQALASLSVSKLQHLTDALIDLTLLTHDMPEFASVDLKEIIDDVRDLLAVELKDTSGRLLQTDLPSVQGNATMLRRLFLNIIGNAIKYRRPSIPPQIEISLVESASVVIAIADNGIGIAPKDAEAIFEPSKRLEHHAEVEGTGLGLAIARRIVEQHGGSIALDPSHRGGARFLLEFPAPL